MFRLCGEGRSRSYLVAGNKMVAKVTALSTRYQTRQRHTGAQTCVNT